MFFRKSRIIKKLNKEINAWKEAYADIGQEHISLLQEHSLLLERSIKDNKNYNELSKKIDSAERFMYAQLQEIKDLSENVNISIVGLLNEMTKNAQTVMPVLEDSYGLGTVDFDKFIKIPKPTEPTIEVINNNPVKKKNSRAEIGKNIKVKKTGDEGLITFIFRDKKPLEYEIVLNNKEKTRLKRNQFDVL